MTSIHVYREYIGTSTPLYFRSKSSRPVLLVLCVHGAKSKGAAAPSHPLSLIRYDFGTLAERLIAAIRRHSLNCLNNRDPEVNKHHTTVTAVRSTGISQAPGHVHSPVSDGGPLHFWQQWPRTSQRPWSSAATPWSLALGRTGQTVPWAPDPSVSKRRAGRRVGLRAATGRSLRSAVLSFGSSNRSMRRTARRCQAGDR